MIEDIAISAVVGLVIICVTTVLPLSLAYMKRTERMKGQQQLPVPDIVARLERMEAGMQSMATEIERIGEGQRFTTKLLNARGDAALGARNMLTERD
ncbi:MAG: hypothetical protein ABI026_08420 [Gemmatimonadaceae bacterium]